MTDQQQPAQPPAPDDPPDGGWDPLTGLPAPPPPAPPPPAPAAAPDYGTPPQTPATPPPYGAPQTPPPYGAPQTPPAYGAPQSPPAYGAPPPHGAPGYPPPFGGQNPYGAPVQGQIAGSTITLLVVSGVLTVTCWFALGGLPALIVAIVAMSKARTDPEGSRRLTRIGWVTLGILSALGIVLTVGFVLFAASTGSTGP